MLSAILLWGIVYISLGVFIVKKVPSIVGTKGVFATIIRIVGVVIAIGGVFDVIGMLI